ncbi:unnamed protein product [Mesocestoides corti]|uniref:Translocon-associated protein subunit gamma n=1 Tax=Mesocestoides corti TaxID=53468 RepID=A0A0R3U131_MESCO|nr:unnamed protein product [Mesocestoides corti]
MKITKEEELLLEQYGRTPSNKSNKLIYVNALLVSLTPIWLYWRIHEMELIPHLILFSIFTGLATYLISCAYTNSKAPLMERIRQKTKDVADYESTTFSIFYINAIFILIVMITSTILHQLSDPVNYAFSMLIASGLTAFLSSAKQTKQHRP